MTTLVIATWVLGLVIAMGSVYITKNIFVKMVEDSEIRRANKKVLPSLNEPSEIIDEDINGIPNDADIKRIKIDANEGAVVHYK
ncbi:MAG: hypothetical protein SV377_05425 [Halobacteria archaeon]|nr:hypothetical protein [Halobacteria archaeon]